MSVQTILSILQFILISLYAQYILFLIPFLIYNFADVPEEATSGGKNLGIFSSFTSSSPTLYIKKYIKKDSGEDCAVLWCVYIVFFFLSFYIPVIFVPLFIYSLPLSPPPPTNDGSWGGGLWIGRLELWNGELTVTGSGNVTFQG